MRDLRIATAQFEHRDGDKAYNLSHIAALTGRAKDQGAEVVSFHECCITGYTFMQPLGRDELAKLAEPVPDGESVRALIDIARDHNVILLAGLLERDGDVFFNTYVAVSPSGFLAKHRKLHAFINPHVSSGNSYTVFDLPGVSNDGNGQGDGAWRSASSATKAGILTCYDNNLPENGRITALLGAEIIFMPHVTGCLPSVMPGRGTVDAALWHNRDRDPARLRKEFDGPKGRGWLHRWLPARAWENGVYAVYSNCIGVDGDTIKPGGAMILDPFGEIIAECRTLDDDVVVAVCTAEKIEQSPGRRYLRARRPELYDQLTAPLPEGETPVTEPGWTRTFDRK